MTDDRGSEIQSIVRMLLYLRAEMTRNDLGVAAGHLDQCLEAIAREFKARTATNVIDFAEEARSRSIST